MRMFDEMLKQMEQLNGQQVSMQIQTDADGYLDRQCNSSECHFQFKVLLSDWKAIFRDEQVFCPLCRHEAPAKDWNTAEQTEQIRQQVGGHVKALLSQALHKGARDLNRSLPKSGMVTVSIKASGSPAQHVFVPIAAKDAFTLKVACRECTAHYAVIGSGFFCPNCGHNSAEQTFEDALRKIEAKLDNLDLVREAFAKVQQVDAGELVARSLVETALSDCVSALQRVCEELFRRHYPVETIPSNIFQRLDDANGLWNRKLGMGYSDWLTEDQLQEMKMLYQRRHLLAHSEGMVDDKYIQKSQDAAYVSGQRIVVKERDVKILIGYIMTIVANLKRLLSSS